MESTGKYYIPVYNALEGYISNVVVSNPKWVAVIKGEKDDNKDAKWIADLFKLGIVHSSFIPEKVFRNLRELTRYIYKLTCMKSSEKIDLSMHLQLETVSWTWFLPMYLVNHLKKIFYLMLME